MVKSDITHYTPDKKDRHRAFLTMPRKFLSTRFHENFHIATFLAKVSCCHSISDEELIKMRRYSDLHNL